MTLRRIRWRIGRRGAFLALFGAVYLLLGYSYLGVQVTPQVRHALRLALTLAPLSAYAWAWIATGAIAVLSGLLLSPARKALGFIAAVLMPTLWALVYLASWLNGDLPRGWTSAAVFALLAAAVGVVAGMPEPSELGVQP